MLLAPMSEKPGTIPLETLRNDLYVSTKEAVTQLEAGKLMLTHNGSVYAILGNANSPTFLEDVNELKHDDKRVAVGWIVPFRRALPLVDTSVISDGPIRDLLKDPNALTARCGGTAFIKMQAIPEALSDPRIPKGLISPDEGTVQPFSVTGLDFMNGLLRRADAKGVEPFMTSANLHGQPEIVFRDDAEKFALDHDLSIWHDGIEVTEQTVPLGSYPIWTARGNELALTRVGCITPELSGRFMDGYKTNIYPNDQKQSTYEGNMFGVDDLEPQYRDLRGRMARLGFLATLGLQETARDMLEDMLRCGYQG